MAEPKLTKDSASKVFGERVRTLRLERTGLSQEEFADRVGVHRTFIGRVERGETNLTLANILRICAALEVTLTEFFRDFEKTVSQ
jgi:transcriptional regulator with XRE-family HTH domain